MTQYAAKVRGKIVAGWTQNKTSIENWVKTLKHQGHKSAKVVSREKNPSRRRTKRANASKRATRARVSKALKKFMESYHGKGKTAGAKIKRNPGGSITIIPVKIRRKR